jgi:chemotaxis protein methyltransferase CheR
MVITQALQDIVAKKYGLVPRSSKEMQRAIDIICSQYRISEDALLGEIRSKNSILQELVQHLTVEESFFFRSIDHVEHLIEEVKRCLYRDHRLAVYTVLSAGCSSGQEPYSIAIMLNEAFGSGFDRNIKIVAIDINRRLIDRACKGVYNHWSFRNVPDWVQPRYFSKLSRGRYRIKDDIKKMVDFKVVSVHDYLNHLADNSIDYVFFRNVAIYFTGSAQIEVFNKLRRVLKEDGLLFIAPTDPLPQKSLFKRSSNQMAGILMPVTHVPKEAKRPGKYDKHPAAVKLEKISKVVYSKPACESTHASIETAVRFADLGMIERALQIADEIVCSKTDRQKGYFIRGQFYLSISKMVHAISDLKQAVSLEPTDDVARYWYAIALQGNKDTKEALMQLRLLKKRLKTLPESAVIDNQNTSVKDLLKAVSEMEDRL